MKIINYHTLQEKLFYEKMDNGLEVYLLPKKGFSKTYGLFSTKFGSIDTTFIPYGEDVMLKVPDGIAHFLEHKMFEMPDGDASEKFAALGASTNAFTSSSRTAYLFNTTENEIQCVELLLDFVQNIYLTDESVEKEKGIINQEIGMYDDDPDWRCYFGSIQNLYQNHPVKIDIAGTVETVSKINKEILEKCYHTFYHPSNMMLFVVGNIDPQAMMEIIRKNQNSKSFSSQRVIQRQTNKEPKDVDKREETLTMDVTMPKLIVSLKINNIPQNPIDKLKRELGMNILLDILFSKSSELYEEWVETGIINDSFSASFTQERDYSFLQIGGDTLKPKELKEKIFELIENISHYSISEQDFQRILKKDIGILISAFNSPEGIANLFSRYYFEGIMAFDMIDVLSCLTIQDIDNLKTLLKKEYTSVFMIYPN